MKFVKKKTKQSQIEAANAEQAEIEIETVDSTEDISIETAAEPAATETAAEPAATETAAEPAAN